MLSLREGDKREGEAPDTVIWLRQAHGKVQRPLLSLRRAETQCAPLSNVPDSRARMHALSANRAESEPDRTLRSSRIDNAIAFFS
jgi:hypothetical protein